jgi:hypothetical protein
VIKIRKGQRRPEGNKGARSKGGSAAGQAIVADYGSGRRVLLALFLATALALLLTVPAKAAVVTPTQWVAKSYTESLGKPPSPASWNSWMTYYGPTRDCNATTLKASGRPRYTATDFLGLGYDNAAKLIALYRGVLNRDPGQSEFSTNLAALNAGTLSWTAMVDSLFSSSEFANLVPAVCNSSDPNYSFSNTPPGDLRQWAYGTASRTQRQLQTALDNAQATCASVSLASLEVVRIGGDQPGTDPDYKPLRIPSCVTLKTAGAPDARHYAKMGRLFLNGLVCDPSCDHAEAVRLGNGSTLSNVWVEGRGYDARNQQLALVGVGSGQSATQVRASRLSDAPPQGTAVRLDGYGTSGQSCSGRVTSGNLITGYTTKHATSRLGRAEWSDGISVFCEQATVQNNDVVDVSGRGIVAHGSWNSVTGEKRIQHSTVSGNRIVSAGISGSTALGADAVGECLSGGTDGPVVDCIEFSHDRGTSAAERSFAGTSFATNSFWTGSRTSFDIGLMVGSKMVWGDNGPFARGASFTNNTTAAVTTTRVNTGIAISGMYGANLSGNTAAYNVIDTHPSVTEAKCPRGNVLYESGLADFVAGSQSASAVSGLYSCVSDNPPAGGMERIALGPARTFVGTDSGERFIPWGEKLGADTQLDLDVHDIREIKQMGANTVRFHLQFKDIMQDCTTANPTALAKLSVILRRAEENGIYLDLIGLGSFAGDDHDPACYRDATEAERWAAQEAFWHAVAQTVAGSPAVMALDIQNEPSIPGGDTPCWAGPAPASQPDAPYCRIGFGGSFFVPNITRTPNGRSPAEIGRAWVTRMRDAIRAYDSEHLITLGCLPFNSRCAGMPLPELAGLLDYLSVHIYPEDCTGPPPSGAETGPCRLQRTLENATGDPLSEERRLLADFAASGDPVVVEETFTLHGTSDLTKDFILQSRSYATGWLGQWRGLTLSQEWVTWPGPDGYVPWGSLVQRLTGTISAPQHTTTTGVTCTPSSVAVNLPTTCTASVSDISSSAKITPTGTVRFVDIDAEGGFSGGASCSLNAGATTGQASCSVTYTPSATGSRRISAGYGSDRTDAASSGTTTVTATKRTSSTSIACVPSFAYVNGTTTCTATVSDVTSGAAITPTGSVSFSTGGAGSFPSGTTCSLSASATTGRASCSVTYRPAATGNHILTGNYAGDVNHGLSTGKRTVFVKWSATGNMTKARSEQTAILLQSGSVLVAGGNTSAGITASSELYNPATGTWSATGNMTRARAGHTATLLQSGKVLVAGGRASAGPIAGAELYDPATGTWSATGNMTRARTKQTATLLQSGKVLVTGGTTSAGPTATAELYDPATGTWSATGSMAGARAEHTGTLLPSGKVLVTGGTISAGPTATAELYDPATSRFSTGGSMVKARARHTATLLQNGTVLVAGGQTSTGPTATAELYNPATGSWSAAATMLKARTLSTATVLQSGKVLVAGGSASTGSIAAADLYDPIAGKWSGSGSMTKARAKHAATLLQSGKVLVAGGQTSTGSTASAELYTP